MAAANDIRGATPIDSSTRVGVAARADVHPGGLLCGHLLYGVHDSVLCPCGVAHCQAPVSAGRLESGQRTRWHERVWNMSTRRKRGTLGSQARESPLHVESFVYRLGGGGSVTVESKFSPLVRVFCPPPPLGEDVKERRWQGRNGEMGRSNIPLAFKDDEKCIPPNTFKRSSEKKRHTLPNLNHTPRSRTSLILQHPNGRGQFSCHPPTPHLLWLIALPGLTPMTPSSSCT